MHLCSIRYINFSTHKSLIIRGFSFIAAFWKLSTVLSGGCNVCHHIVRYCSNFLSVLYETMFCQYHVIREFTVCNYIDCWLIFILYNIITRVSSLSFPPSSNLLHFLMKTRMIYWNELSLLVWFMLIYIRTYRIDEIKIK